MKIESLYIYPIKSCGGIRLEGVRLTPRGFQHDREFVVIDQKGMFVSQRSVPRMCLIKTCLRDNTLVVNAPGMPEAIIVLDVEEGVRREVTVWGDRCYGLDQGDDLADWFGTFLGQTGRLVRYTARHPRRRKSSYLRRSVSIRFTDAYPLLIISQESLSDLNRRLSEPLPMNRFRPNIVVSGGEPYAEDRWYEIAVNGIRLQGATQCVRCAVTTVDQATSERTKEPLQTLSQYRKPGKGVLFGRNFIALDSGFVQSGSPVQVTEHYY